MQCSKCRLVEMRVEKVENKIVNHKCPKCGMEVNTKIEDEEE